MKDLLFISSNRADSGMLAELMLEFKKNSKVNTKLLITGQHISNKQKKTTQNFESFNLKVNYEIEIPSKNNNSCELNQSFSYCISKFSEFFVQKKINNILILGDRYEILAIAIAAFNHKINIFHFHGGEHTPYSLDQGYRNCISNLSSFHFVSHDNYKKKLIFMGINKKKIFNVGSISLEKIRKIKSYFNFNYYLVKYNIDISQLFFLVIIHPEDTTLKENYLNIKKLFDSLIIFKEFKVVFISSNNDIFGYKLDKLIKFNIKSYNNFFYFKSLNQIEFFSLIKISSIFITNSSSGIYEAPSLKTPTLNLGKRQKGRIFSNSIFSCNFDNIEITRKIKIILKKKKSNLINYTNPYFKKNTSLNIIKKVESELLF